MATFDVFLVFVALAFGFLTGILGVSYFLFFTRELVEGRINRISFVAFIIILIGVPVASVPIGMLVFSLSIWPWVVLGEGLCFIPGCFFVVYYFVWSVNS